MKEDLRVGVVLGTYNRLPHLKRAVDSVLFAAGRYDVHFVIVDGGSTDGTIDFVSEQANTTLICQSGPLTGAVTAFNHGFASAVRARFPYIVHFNDDAEFVTPDAIERAIDDHLVVDPTVGEVAFQFDLRGPWAFETIYEYPYANFGVVRLEAGMAVARAQGDLEGKKWWNPIYRTYGADCEFGCWLWRLGWKVALGHGLHVHDVNVQDALRAGNESSNPDRKDSKLFWDRWPSPLNIEQEGPVKCVF